MSRSVRHLIYLPMYLCKVLVVFKRKTNFPSLIWIRTKTLDQGIISGSTTPGKATPLQYWSTRYCKLGLCFLRMWIITLGLWFSGLLPAWSPLCTYVLFCRPKSVVQLSYLFGCLCTVLNCRLKSVVQLATLFFYVLYCPLKSVLYSRSQKKRHQLKNRRFLK